MAFFTRAGVAVPIIPSLAGSEEADLNVIGSDPELAEYNQGAGS